MFSCTKQKTYTCVCYPYSSPENYKKYPIQNTYEESTKYCDTISNSYQKCSLSE